MASSSSSVFCHIGTDSSATCSEISGTCGTGLRRVLARMKALRSAIMLALCRLAARKGRGYRADARGASSCPPSSPTAFSAISTSCARSAPTRPACIGRRFRPRTSRRGKWFAEQCTAAGLETTIDGIGNILGKSKAGGAKALSGSHLESQNHAGWLDGPLGCVYALEASRAIKEAGGDAGVDVVVFCDEEGHFGSFLGSRSRSPALLDGRGHRQGARTARRHADARCAREGRLCGPPAPRDRARSATRRSSRRISSRAIRSRATSCASASSRRSWRSGSTASR